MKKFYVSAILLCTWSAAWSQITITKNDMPSAKDTARYSTSNSRPNFETTGPQMLWDFSTLVASGQGIDSFRQAYLINAAYTLLFGLDDYGFRTTNLSNIGPLSLSNTYNFYKKTNSYLEINGFAGEYNGIPIPAPYTIPDKLYQFPLTYGRKDTTAYEMSITIPGLGALHQVGKRYNNVDGWGEVITPYTAFFCLRLRSYTAETDSLTITALNLTIPIPQNKLTYQWLANGEKIPVLEASGTLLGNIFVPNSVKFRDAVRFIPPAFALRTDFRASKTTCTTRDTVTITNRTRPAVNGSTYQYTITPATYSFVNGTAATDASPEVNFYAPGRYTVSLHVESPAGGSVPAIGDTTKVDYIDVAYPTGIQDITDVEGIQVYPNPVANVLNIRTSDLIKEVSLMNERGQRVMTRAVGAASLSLDVKAFPQGIYLLDIQTTTGREVRKIVIQ